VDYLHEFTFICRRNDEPSHFGFVDPLDVLDPHAPFRAVCVPPLFLHFVIREVYRRDSTLCSVLCASFACAPVVLRGRLPDRRILEVDLAYGCYRLLASSREWRPRRSLLLSCNGRDSLSHKLLCLRIGNRSFSARDIQGLTRGLTFRQECR
jgi:hypothetical protein